MEKNAITDKKPFNLCKSHTFASFTHNSSHKISNWFAALNERRKKSAIKNNENVALPAVQEIVTSEEDENVVAILEKRQTNDSLTETGNDKNDNRLSPVKARKFALDAWPNKRLSLPITLIAPESFTSKRSRSPEFIGPLSRASRRQSLSDFGFGRKDSYIWMDIIGQGAYATVYQGLSLLTGQFVALKEIRLEREEGAPCTAIREVSLLKQLRHANIVTLHDVIYTEKMLTLVFEYVKWDLRQLMDKYELTSYHIKLFLFQILRGLAYCHCRKILHRDLKPHNILINDKGELKLGDFGLARSKTVPTETYSKDVVTLWYRPPDVLLGSTRYSTQIDMWCVGCIFYEMIDGRALFPGSDVELQSVLIFDTLGEPPKDCWPDVEVPFDSTKCERAPTLRPQMSLSDRLKHLIGKDKKLYKNVLDLMAKFLQYEASKRISAADAMKHPYFSDLGPEVHSLADEESIFSIPSIKFQPISV